MNKKKRKAKKTNRGIYLLATVIIAASLYALIWLVSGIVGNNSKDRFVEIDAEIEKPVISEDFLDDGVIKEPFCTSALLYSSNDNSIIYADNIEEKIAPASLTKLLTASVALYYFDSDDVITVGSELEMVHLNSSLCYISKGQKLTLYDLVSGMLMVSGNDAAYTVAAATARKINPEKNLSDSEAVDFFVDLMNGFAESIGMENSNFKSPDGFDSNGQYTTAKDLLTLTRYAMKNETIREIVSTPQRRAVFVSGETITWKNTNSFLDGNSKYYCDKAIGVKTGTTAKAGSNLISAFSSDGNEYISVVVGCRNDYDRYDLTLNIIDGII